MIDLLIKKGANASIVDKNGQLAWQDHYQTFEI